jgi:hypothetical protein
VIRAHVAACSLLGYTNSGMATDDGADLDVCTVEVRCELGGPSTADFELALVDDTFSDPAGKAMNACKPTSEHVNLRLTAQSFRRQQFEYRPTEAYSSVSCD